MGSGLWGDGCGGLSLGRCHSEQSQSCGSDIQALSTSYTSSVLSQLPWGIVQPLSPGYIMRQTPDLTLFLCVTQPHLLGTLPYLTYINDLSTSLHRLLGWTG